MIRVQYSRVHTGGQGHNGITALDFTHESEEYKAKGSSVSGEVTTDRGKNCVMKISLGPETKLCGVK